jgi:hypothetical protein
VSHVRSFAGRRFREHFRQRLLQALDHERRLEINGLREELAQFFHPNRLAGLIKLGPRIPGTIRCIRITRRVVPQPDWQERSLVPGKAQEFRETLLEWSPLALRVPNEVTDPE